MDTIAVSESGADNPATTAQSKSAPNLRYDRDAELAAYKRAKHLADLEVIELRAHLKEAEQLKNSLYYRLGQIVVEFFTTWRGFVFFWPRTVKLLLSEFAFGRRRRRPTRSSSVNERRVADFSFELDALKGQIAILGPAGAAAWVRERALSPALSARLLIEIAKQVRRTDLPLAISLGFEVIRLDKSEQRSKWLALILAESGAITDAAKMMRQIVSTGARLAGSEQRAVDELFRLEEALVEAVVLPPSQAASVGPAGIRRILLLANHHIGEKWSMDAVRLHASALAIHKTGREVMVVTIPDTPHEPASGAADPMQMIDGIGYHTLPLRFADLGSPSAYLKDVASCLASFALQHAIDAFQVELTVALAKVALLAGRRASLPVILDYAGDEIFQVPQGIRAADTERASLCRAQQGRLAAQADRLVRRLPLLHPDLHPDAIPPAVNLYDSVIWNKDQASSGGRSLFGLRDRAPLSGRRIIGFFGEASPCYDLELFGALPTVLAERHAELPAPGFLLVGKGRTLERLQARAAMEGFDDRLRFTRSPSFWSIPDVVSAMDIFVAPLRNEDGGFVRTPFEVLQAFACGVPVVVPATPEADRWLSCGLPVMVANGSGAADIADAAASLLTNNRLMISTRERVRAFAERQLGGSSPTEALDGLYDDWRKREARTGSMG